MRRKLIFGALICGLIFSSGVAQANTIVINGVPMPAAVDTTVINGATYAPFRAVVEALDGNVVYLPAEKSFIGYLEGAQVKIVLGANTAYVDGNPYYMKNPAVNIDGMAMVPVRFMAYALGLSISYNPYDRVVTISDGTVPAPAAVVERVDSGDTIYVSMNKGTTFATVKLQGLYVVGSSIPTDVEKSIEKMAKEYLKTAILGKTVYLESDVTNADSQGRLLRYVWTEKIRPENFTSKTVNAEMVRKGLGRVISYPPDNKYLSQLSALERSAKINNSGYWGLSGWSPLVDYYGQ